MSAAVKPNAPHRLIVEGRDDQWTIINLLAKYGWSWDPPDPFVPYVHDAKGVQPAIEALGPAVRTYARVGIVVDADLHVTDRWSAVRDRLAREGVEAPMVPDPEGTVIAWGAKRVGVWLMPDNLRAGKLEDFLGYMVPPGDERWGWSAEATTKARTLGAAFSEGDFVKARVHTWLAWAEEPGQPFGTALTAGVFAHDAAVAQRFVAWMNRLFR